MARSLFIVLLFLCCGFTQAQTTGTATVSSSKYVGVQAKMPDSSQVNTTTNPRFLKTNFTASPVTPGNNTSAGVPNGTGKNKYAGVQVLPAPTQNNEEEKKKTDPAKKE